MPTQPEDRAAGAALSRLFVRPLGQDEERVAFWVRHVRIGVALSVLGGLLVAVYAVAAQRPARDALLVLAAAVLLGTPAVLALPVERIARSPHGALFFYAWSLCVTTVIAVGAALDGGARSPLVLLLFLTLTYVGLAYPPAGVAVMGGVMVVGYLATALVGTPPSAELGVMAGVLVLFTAMSVWTSLNQWDVHDRHDALAAQLRTLALLDPLTGCLNRAGLRAQLAALGPARGGHAPLTVCVLDLDGFKQVNDTRGHRAGDEVLVAVATALHDSARSGDVVARLGGDEFAVLLPRTSGAAAEQVVRRLVDAVHAAVGRHGVTASVGTAAWRGADQDLEQVLDEADRAMYAAKGHAERRRPVVPAPTSPGDAEARARR